MFVFKKRNLIIVSVLIAVFLTFLLCVGALHVNPASGSEPASLKIVLDAGHGGVDSGTVGVNTGVKESELNLKVVKILEKYLAASGFSVVLTRNSDAGLYGLATNNLKKKDMQKRKEIIEQAAPALVVSVHMNKYPMQSRRGAQVFYKSSDEKGKELASSIQNSFNEMETSIRDFSPLVGDYYILNCTEYPSVIAECGFLSNPEEEALLITEDYQDKVAYAIFKGIINYLSVESFYLAG